MTMGPVNNKVPISVINSTGDFSVKQQCLEYSDWSSGGNATLVEFLAIFVTPVFFRVLKR